MNKRKTAFLVILAVAAVGLWFVPEVTAWLERKPDEAWARIQHTGVIRFAINPTYMPFDGLGSHGDFFGLDVDVANEIARRLDKRAEFVVAGFDSLYDVLRVGQAEATISALPIDPAKFGTWRYSEPYFEAGQVMISKPPRSLRSTPQQSGVGETSEVSLAVEYGSDADAAARYLARRREGIEIKYTESADDALKAVANSWADKAIVDGVSAQQLLPKYPDLGISEQVTHDPYAIAMWGESDQLVVEINVALAAMKADGTLSRIVDEWMKK
jgi:ABC-type amino acid transport substrate-binding protein